MMSRHSERDCYLLNSINLYLRILPFHFFYALSLLRLVQLGYLIQFPMSSSLPVVLRREPRS